MKTMLSVICPALLLIAFALNVRAYRRADPAKKPRARAGLAISSVSLALLGGFALSNMS